MANIPCNEENCQQSFRTVEYFRQHLKSQHGQDHPIIPLHFKNEEEMKQWQKDYEEKYLVNFRYRSKNKTGTIYYFCNRSRMFSQESKSTGQRAAKETIRKYGPSQSKGYCTAGFTICEKMAHFRDYYILHTQITLLI